MTRLPTGYVAAMVALLGVAVLVTLVFFGVPPFDNLQVFILTNVVGFFTLLILGVVGGAFVGMLLAQRILGNREFSPFEHSVLRGLEDVRERLDALETHLGARDEREKRR